jgi:hypothetical protein
MLRLGSDRSDTIVPSYAEPLHSFILVVAGYEPIGSDVTGLLSNLTLAVAGQAPFGRCRADQIQNRWGVFVKAQDLLRIEFLVGLAIFDEPIDFKQPSLRAVAAIATIITAKVAGTEVGVTEPQATFSACFGAPFLVWHPAKYAELLASKMKQHGVHVWLINTGWPGGSYGQGSRIKLKYTRVIIDVIHSGALSSATTKIDSTFGFEVVVHWSNVPNADGSESLFVIRKGNGNASKRVCARAIEPSKIHCVCYDVLPYLTEATT